MSPTGNPDPQIHRITDAGQAQSDDQDRRINRYLISMAIRTVCVILVLVVPGPLRYVFAVGAVFLPYVAVVLANAGRRRTPPPAALGQGGPAPLRLSAVPVPPQPSQQPAGPPPGPAAGSAQEPEPESGQEPAPEAAHEPPDPGRQASQR